MKRCLLLGFALTVALTTTCDRTTPSRHARAVVDTPTVAPPSQVPTPTTDSIAKTGNSADNDFSHKVVQKLLSTKASSDMGFPPTLSNSTGDGGASLMFELNSILTGFGVAPVTDLRQVPGAFTEGAFQKPRAASSSDIMKMVNEFVGSSSQGTPGGGSFDLSKMMSILGGGSRGDTSGGSTPPGGGLDISKLMRAFGQPSKGAAGGTGPGSGGFDLTKLIGGLNKPLGVGKDQADGAGIFSLGSLVGGLLRPQKTAAVGGAAGLEGILAAVLGMTAGKAYQNGEGGVTNTVGK